MVKNSSYRISLFAHVFVQSKYVVNQNIEIIEMVQC